MLGNYNRQLGKNPLALIYFLSTIFIVFFSVNAVQNWLPLLGQGTLVFACLLPVLGVLIKNRHNIFKEITWSVELKFVLVIIVLGMLNICFSEDQFASLKGMSLFLMSGVVVFSVSYSLFKSKQAQKNFFCLCSFCFVAVLVYGAFEFFQQVGFYDQKILLFSGNPIPAGSLLIILSIGPLISLEESENNWQRLFWVFCLLSGALLITLIAQRGPALAMIVMAFFIAATKRKGIWIFTVVALIFVGAGYQFGEKIPSQFKNELIKKETLLVRMELYYIALEVVREKPIFGIGFNAPLSRFIPNEYESKVYTKVQGGSFKDMVAGLHVFDNMALSFLGEAGGLFTLAYIGLGVYVLVGIKRSLKSGFIDQTQTILTLIVLVVFMAHSMTFDSLKYPHLNWIFHSLLGLVAQCQVSNQKELNGSVA